jgi:hypothetical protein
MSCDQRWTKRFSGETLCSRMAALLLVFAASLSPLLAPAFAHQSRNEQMEARAKALVSDVFISVVAGELPKTSPDEDGRRSPRCSQEDIADAIKNPQRAAQILSQCGLAPSVTGAPQYLDGDGRLWLFNTRGWTWTIEAKNKLLCERFVEAFDGVVKDLRSMIFAVDDRPDHMAHFQIASVRIARSHYTVRLLQSTKEFSARCDAGSIVIRLVP